MSIMLLLVEGYSVRLNLADGIQCRCFVWFGELTTLKIVILLNLRYGYEKSRQYHLESRFKLCYLALMVVGIGSTLFHCTLYRSAQLMDELPMIWCVSVFLYTISPEAFSSKHPRLLMCLCAGYSLVISVAYVYNKNALFHEVCYGIGVGIVILLCVVAIQKHRQARSELLYVLRIGLLWSGCAFVVWTIDNVFCRYLRMFRNRVGWPLEHLSQFHAFWHIGVGIGTYFFIVFAGMVSAALWMSGSSS
mmetsp:Transcript_443/g.674  ORF Transcript_443/g.674 Transcript_443/m.674 type:complete len:248 (+) Transcript_443:282-1025(+)